MAVLRFMLIAKAMADESRVRMLMALQRGELCVCQIIEMSGLAPSTVSKHMAILRQAGLVEARKDSRWVHYRMAGREAPLEVREALRWVCSSLGQDARVREDARRLGAVLKRDPAELCRRQQMRRQGLARRPRRARGRLRRTHSG